MGRCTGREPWCIPVSVHVTCCLNLSGNLPCPRCADGERYEGQWNFGKREGFGIYYYLGESCRL